MVNDMATQKEIDEANARKKLVEKNKLIADLINPIPVCPYRVDVEFSDVEYVLDRYNKNYDGGLQMNPDFQRGHVWTEEQQIAYIENFIRGAVGELGRTITLSCSEFQKDREKHSDLIGFYVVDGLQRLTAVMRFVKGEFKIFHHIDGGVDKDFFNGSGYSIRSNQGLAFNVFRMQTKKEILDYYLAMNGGGTPHNKEEIDRVTKMRQELN